MLDRLAAPPWLQTGEPLSESLRADAQGPDGEEHQAVSTRSGARQQSPGGQGRQRALPAPR